MDEDQIVEIALTAIKAVIKPPLSIERGASLLYQVTVDNRLTVRVNPRRPMRGHSAFQTDLCIFEEVEEDVRLPRVVLEFKATMGTHDVLTYSAKARKHKQIYPYLRYGIIVGREQKVAAKFFIHNESLDFCCAAATYIAESTLGAMLEDLILAEIRSSKVLEAAAFEKSQWRLFRTDVVVDPPPVRTDF